MISENTTLIKSMKRVKNYIGMIHLDESFKSDFNWTGSENFIKKWYTRRYSLLKRITFRNKWFGDMRRLNLI